MIYHRIPYAIKQDVIDTIEFVQPNLPKCPKDELEYLFEVYNKYINPTYKDDLQNNCNLCRSEVINKIRNIVNVWKQSQANF